MIKKLKLWWCNRTGSGNGKIVFSGELTFEEKRYMVDNYDRSVTSYVFAEPTDIFELDRVVVLNGNSYYYVRSLLTQTTFPLTEESFRVLFKRRE